MEILGSVKKFHIFVGDSSERELRESREDAEEELGFERGTCCPWKIKFNHVNLIMSFYIPGDSRLAVMSSRLETFPSQIIE